MNYLNIKKNEVSQSDILGAISVILFYIFYFFYLLKDFDYTSIMGYILRIKKIAKKTSSVSSLPILSFKTTAVVLMLLYV